LPPVDVPDTLVIGVAAGVQKGPVTSGAVVVPPCTVEVAVKAETHLVALYALTVTASQADNVKPVNDHVPAPLDTVALSFALTYKYTVTPATLSGAAIVPLIVVVVVKSGEVVTTGVVVATAPPIQTQKSSDSHFPGSVAVTL
jgi:hypothetical protein